MPIDLQEEEDALVLTLGQNCESQKGAVASDIRKQKDAECENKLNPIEIALEKAEEDAKDWESKYDSCKEDLDACEDG